MPKTYRYNGKTVTVPDDATMEDVQAFFEGQNAPATPDPPPQKPESMGQWWDRVTEPYTKIEKPDPKAPALSMKEAGKAVGNIGAGGLGLLLHPVNALESVGGMITAPGEMIAGKKFSETVPGQLVQSLKENPLGTIEAGIGQAGASGVVEGGLKTIPKVLGKAGEVVTQTGPKVTENLVKDTKAANEAETAKAAEKNAKQDAERKVDLRRHFEKTQSVKKANAESQAPAARKAALERGVKELDPRVHSELQGTEKQINEIANKKYNDLRAVLKDEQAGPYQPVDEEGHVTGEPQTITEHLYDVASAPLRGTETESTIVKSLGKRVESGEVSLSYNDLQGYREEIGRKLRSGTLPPGEYAAYKAVMPEIDNAMQEIANRKGLGKQQTDARNYYREYARTFIDKQSPVRQAVDVGKSLKRTPGSVVNKLQGKDAAVEQLAKYNPDLARKTNTIGGYQAEAKSISGKPKPLKSLPKLEPKPEPVKPDLKKIGPEEIQQAKQKSLEQRTGVIRRRGEWIATGAAGYRALSSILHGDLAAVPPDLLEGGLAIAGVEGISRILENPKVVEFLTKPTARDLAEVPPELRADMSQIAEIASKRGIKVDPRIYAAAGATQPRKRVAAALTQ